MSIPGIKTALVVGANGGLGLALTRAMLEDAGLESLRATYRDRERAAELLAVQEQRLKTNRLDVTESESIQEMAGTLREQGESPDLVIYCAGVLHGKGLQPEKSLAQCDPEDISHVFAINTTAPLMIAKAIIPLLPRRTPTHFAALSAMVGSIGDNRLGGWYSYRASKAALNQFMRTLSIECHRTHPGMCVTSIHPGTTDTPLTRPFQANVEPDRLYTPDQSARRILSVLANSTVEDSGQFVNWDGQPITP